MGEPQSKEGELTGGIDESSDRRTTDGGDARTSRPSLSASSIEIGTRLEGTYEVKKLLGQGAMGAVYLVEHVGLGKQFAAKVVSASRALDESAVARLRNEARITSAIEHENIVNVTHLGATPDGSLFIVMELLRGENLRERVVRHQTSAKATGGPVWLPDDEVRSTVSATLSALAAAHAAGVVHRDLKPDNVFLSQTRSGQTRPKIVDFGIGKLHSLTAGDLRLTETGQTVGTPLYMAPEQFRASSYVGPAADLYALGVLVFELLTGELPFQASHVYEMVLKHATESAPDPRVKRPDLPAAVAEVVLTALEKAPENRFASADEMLAAWRAAWGETSELPPSRPRVKTASSESDATSSSPSRAEPVPMATPQAAPPPGISLRWWMLPLTLVLGGALVLAVERFNHVDPVPPVPAVVAHEEEPPVIPAERVEVVEPPAPVPAPPSAPVTRVHRITSEPTGADVLIEGTRVGVTPYELTAPVDASVTVELRLAGRRSVERVLDPTSEAELSVRLPREVIAPAGDDFPPLAGR